MKINDKVKNGTVLSLIAFVLFGIFTILIKLIDVQPAGPDGSLIGFASINTAFNKLFSYNESLYKITEILGYAAFVFMAFFAFIGLVQLIKSKSFKKVDASIYFLAVFYVLVLLAYALFEIVIVNYRPIIFGSELEASYPSSHTVLGICVYLSSLVEFRRLFKTKTKIVKVFSIICILFAAMTVIGRLLCGVHWLTDIIGGIMLSAALLMVFKTMLKSTE